MEAFAFYLLKSAVWLAGFSLVYLFFLQNERFFRLKRYFLVAGIMAAFVFPLITIHYKVELPVQSGIIGGPIVPVEAPAPAIQPAYALNGMNISLVLMIVYLSGILVLSVKLVGRMAPVIRYIKGKKSGNSLKAKVIRSSDFRGSFSFFNYIFINSSVADDEIDAIMNHELVHVSQKHWIDLIFTEIIRLFQWINPFAWIYGHFVKQNHEYLADEVAMRKSQNPALYKAVLMNQLLEARVLSLSNSFNYTSTRKRFDMMKKSFRSPYRKMKLLLIIPVMGSIFYSFAAPVYRYSENDMAANQLIVGPDQFFPANHDSVQNTQLNTIEGSVISQTKESFESLSVARKVTLKTDRSSETRGYIVKNGIDEILNDNGEIFPGFVDPVLEDQKSVKGIVLNENLQPLEKVNVTVNEEMDDSSATSNPSISEEVIKSEPYVVVEQMPQYPGGEIELLKFIAENTRYPEEAKVKGIQGRVIVRFIVNKDGNTEGISLLKGVDPLLDAEAIRVVSILTGFKPGMQGGNPVPVWYMVPINFNLN